MIRLCYSEHPDYVPLLRRTYELWAQLQAQTGRDLLHLTGGLYLGRADGELVGGWRARAQAAQDQEYRRLLYVALTRAEDRLIVCGWRGKNAAPVGCWYNLVAGALDATSTNGAAEPVDFDFSGEVAEDGWSGPGWRLRSVQTADSESDREEPGVRLHAL